MHHETGNKSRKSNLTAKPVKRGAIAGTLLLAAYFVILTLANSFSHALEQFAEMWYFIVLLAFGFGIQVGLYTYIREASALKKGSGATASSLAASGGISATSMVACCLHHVTDIIPVLGLSAAALFLSGYQTVFIVFGVLSNLVGINMMLMIIEKHGIYDRRRGLLSLIMRFSMKRTMYITLSFSAVIFVLTILNA